MIHSRLEPPAEPRIVARGTGDDERIVIREPLSVDVTAGDALNEVDLVIIGIDGTDMLVQKLDGSSVIVNAGSLADGLHVVDISSSPAGFYVISSGTLVPEGGTDGLYTSKGAEVDGARAVLVEIVLGFGYWVNQPGGGSGDPEDFRQTVMVADDTTEYTDWSVDGNGRLTYNLLIEPAGGQRAIINATGLLAVPFQIVTVENAVGAHMAAELWYDEDLAAYLYDLAVALGAFAPFDFSGGNAQTVEITVDGTPHVRTINQDYAGDAVAFLSDLTPPGCTFAFDVVVPQNDATPTAALITDSTGAGSSIAITGGSGTLAAAMSGLTSIDGDTLRLGADRLDFGTGNKGGQGGGFTHLHTDDTDLTIHHQAQFYSDGTDIRWLRRKMRPEELRFASQAGLTSTNVGAALDELKGLTGGSDPRSILVATVSGAVNENVDRIDADTTLGPIELTLGTTTLAWPIPINLRAGSDTLTILNNDLTPLIVIPGGVFGLRAMLNPGEAGWKAVSLDPQTLYASVVVYCPTLDPDTLLPVDGDPQFWVSWDPDHVGAGDGGAELDGWKTEQSFTWSAGWAADNESTDILLKLDGDWWPSVYAHVTPTGFAHIPVLGGTSMKVGCGGGAEMGFGTPWTAVNFGSGDNVGSAPVRTQLAFFFQPDGVSADQIDVGDNLSLRSWIAAHNGPPLPTPANPADNNKVPRATSGGYTLEAPYTGSATAVVDGDGATQVFDVLTGFGNLVSLASANVQVRDVGGYDCQGYSISSATEITFDIAPETGEAFTVFSEGTNG